MIQPDSNEFAPVTSAIERARVFEMIGLSKSRFNGKNSELTGFASDLNDPQAWNQQYVFELLECTDEALLLQIQSPQIQSLQIQSPQIQSLQTEPHESTAHSADFSTSGSRRALMPNETIEIFFGLDDGCYLLRAVIEKVDGKQVTFATGGSLQRLQRRNNFRVTLPVDSHIRFQLTDLCGKLCKQIDLALVDLSAGGMRLRWSGSGLAPLREGDAIGGQLTNVAATMALKAMARAVLSRNGLTEIGFEFTEIAAKDEQNLMLLCLQIYRTKNSGSSL